MTRIFQSVGGYPAYLASIHGMHRSDTSFSDQKKLFAADRFGASHLLKPALDDDETAFYTIGNDAILQRRWGREHGLSRRASLDDVLLAQLESHRTEVFYDLDPTSHAAGFSARLPRCVRYCIAWRAAPSPGADFSGYDLVVCNFPSILEGYRERGWRTAYFAPGHDPAMDAFAATEERPIDILFVGSYSRHHARRATLLDLVSRSRSSHQLCLHLEVSRMTAWAESAVGHLLLPRRLRRPPAVRAASLPGVYGIELYRRISQAKIVLNVAIDMAGQDRGNMRCFETLGCGAALLSDDGRYPEGMTPDHTIMTYASPQDAIDVLGRMLADPDQTRALAQRGRDMVRKLYAKERQLEAFMRLLGE